MSLGPLRLGRIPRKSYQCTGTAGSTCAFIVAGRKGQRSSGTGARTRRANNGRRENTFVRFARPNSRSFRGRDLGFAVFNRADLRKADFTGAVLDGAEFVGAKLDGAQFKCAKQELNLDWSERGCTSLNGGEFFNAQLQDANLEGARLESAQFSRANLQGAKLDGANLQNATLIEAHAEAASLRDSSLAGANFLNARLQCTR